MKRYVHIRDLFRIGFTKISKNTSKHSLMTDSQHVRFALELSEHRNETLHHVHVRFSLRVTIFEFLLVSERELPGETFLQFFVGKVLAVAL